MGSDVSAPGHGSTGTTVPECRGLPVDDAAYVDADADGDGDDEDDGCEEEEELEQRTSASANRSVVGAGGF